MNGLTCNMKSSRKCERWEESECTLYIVDQNHGISVAVLDHFSDLKCN